MPESTLCLSAPVTAQLHKSIRTILDHIYIFILQCTAAHRKTAETAATFILLNFWRLKSSIYIYKDVHTVLPHTAAHIHLSGECLRSGPSAPTGRALRNVYVASAIFYVSVTPQGYQFSAEEIRLRTRCQWFESACFLPPPHTSHFLTHIAADQQMFRNGSPRSHKLASKR